MGGSGGFAASPSLNPLNLLSLFCKQSWDGTSRGQSLKAGMSG